MLDLAALRRVGQKSWPACKKHRPVIALLIECFETSAFDMIGFGRSLISDANYVSKFADRRSRDRVFAGGIRNIDLRIR